MAASSSPSVPPSVDELIARVADLANRTGPGPDGPRVVSIEVTGNSGVELGFWDPPPHHRPLEPLVGLRAPEAWTAVGITASGRQWALDDPSAPPVAVTTTVVLARTGQAASVITSPGADPRTMADPPEGVVADVLARVLGLPTPPPQHSTAALAELTWLDRIASGLAHRPGHRRSWRWLADRHPLRGGGETPTPATLAARTVRHADRYPWATLRQRADLVAVSTLGDDRPPGAVVEAADWFDDGSLARWTMRQLPDPSTIAAAIVERLPDHVVIDLGAALTEIEIKAA